MKTGIYWQDPKCAVGRCCTDPGCVLYLPLYSLDGASFMSKDAYGHLCTVTGALWTPRGRSFDGVDDVIICGNILASGDWTIEMSVYSVVQDLVVHYICSLSGSNGIWFGGTHANYSDKWGFYDGSSIITASSAIAPSAWFHIVVTKSGTTYTFYLNGNADGSGSGTATYPSAFRIGDRNGAVPFEGYIILSRIYNRVLTPLEIQHNYLATKWRYQ